MKYPISAHLGILSWIWALMLLALISGVLLIIGTMILSIFLRAKEDLAEWTTPEPLAGTDPLAEDAESFTVDDIPESGFIDNNSPQPEKQNAP